MKDKINYYIFLPLLFLLFFLETTFIAQIFYDFFPPNLILIFLVAEIFLSFSQNFLFTVFIFGFLSDLFGGPDFGIFTLSFVLTAMLIYFLKIKFLSEDSFLKVVMLSMCAALIYNIVYLFLAFIVFNNNIVDIFSLVWPKTIFDMLYAAILVYPAMQLISKKTR